MPDRTEGAAYIQHRSQPADDRPKCGADPENSQKLWVE
jgi:hypothetical protein